MAGNVEQLAALIYWGGRIIKHGDMGSVDYSKPPNTMCFLTCNSKYDELLTKVHTAMDTNEDRTRLVLFGRYPTILPGGQVSFVSVPLVDDQSWQWFLQVASRSQPIHVYVNKSFVGKKIGLQNEMKVSDVEEWKQTRLKVILDKITPRNFQWVFEQVKEVNIDNVVTLHGFVSQTWNKAVMEPASCEMLAEVCHRLSCMLPEVSVDDEKVTFKRLLINYCQKEFESGGREQDEASYTEKRRKLGNIRFIGELCKKKLLTERVVHECIKKLVGQYENPNEEDIEALCLLMYRTGEYIDHPKAKEHMDCYFELLSRLLNHPTLSSRLKDMLIGLVDLRKNKWQQKGKAECSKKVEDFHSDSHGE